MTLTAVWLDRTQAMIAHFPRKAERASFKAHHVEHHTHRIDSLDVKREEKAMFERLAGQLEGSAEILLFGPGVAKYHFRNYLAEQHPMLARKVTHFQALGRPSENELQALVEDHLWSKMPKAQGS